MVTRQSPDDGDMEERGAARHVIVAGGAGILVGAALAAGADDSRRNVLDRSTTGAVALSLLLLGLAAWHFYAWRPGKLFSISLLAAGALLLTLVDFGDGEPIRSQGYTGVELVARWLVIASAVVVLIGVVWSLIGVAGSARRRSEGEAASVAWWRRWWMPVAGVTIALWVLGVVWSLIGLIFGSSGQAPGE
jgi:hypothetical protein